MICDRINATIFKGRDTNEEGIETSELENLQIGQNILIKIKSIQNQHNSMFITASFVQIL